MRSMLITLAFAAALLAPAAASGQLGPLRNVLLTDTDPDDDAQFGEETAFGDFDGDGDADLAVSAIRYGSAGSDGRVSVFLNIGGVLTPGLFGGTFVGNPQAQLGRALAGCDVDGDGVDELAIGAPNDSVFDPARGGAVLVYGLDAGAWTLRQTLFQGGVLGGTPGDGDFLGSALACGDFNDDGIDDLAIGVPQKDISGIDNAGVVVVIYGRVTGLSGQTDETWHQNTARDGVAVDDVAEADDRVGSVLAAGDFNGDGNDDLVIGAPDEDYEDLDVVDSGLVHILLGSSDGVTAAGQQTFDPNWMADDDGIGDFSQTDDRYGNALAVGDFNRIDADFIPAYDDLAIAAPGKDTGGINKAGLVYVLNGGSGGDLFEDVVGLRHDQTALAGQDNEGFGNALAAGDFDGDRVDDLAVGRSGRDVNTVAGAGAVTVFDGQPAIGLEDTTTQSFYAQPGYASAPPQYVGGYGASVAAADVDGDGRSDLAVGIRDQPVDGVDQAGAVQMIFTAGGFRDGFE